MWFLVGHPFHSALFSPLSHASSAASCPVLNSEFNKSFSSQRSGWADRFAANVRGPGAIRSRLVTTTGLVNKSAAAAATSLASAQLTEKSYTAISHEFTEGLN